MSAAVFQNRKKLMFKEVEFPYFDDVQQLRNKHHRDDCFHENPAINLNNSFKSYL